MDLLPISNAMAQQAQPGQGEAVIFQLVLLGLIFVIFYFLLIRPQVKRQKEHKKMIEALSKGDEVVTQGGLLGRITDLSESFITMQVSDGVEVNVQRQFISAPMPKGTIKSLSAKD